VQPLMRVSKNGSSCDRERRSRRGKANEEVWSADDDIVRRVLFESKEDRNWRNFSEMFGRSDS
jgi:hypothetical protein